jgi:hypothetical protein
MIPGQMIAEQMIAEQTIATGMIAEQMGTDRVIALRVPHRVTQSNRLRIRCARLSF